MEVTAEAAPWVGGTEYGSVEEERPRAGGALKKGTSCVKTAVVAVFAVALLGSCVIAALVGAAAMEGNSDPADRLHSVLAYLGLGTAQQQQLYCDGNHPEQIPRWDPDYDEKKFPGWHEVGKPASQKFYDVCYRAFRCCTAPTMMSCRDAQNGCRDCLARHAPRTVKPPCDKWIKECKPGSNDINVPNCKATEDAKSWGVAELLADKGVPDSTLPEWMLVWKNMKKYSNTCWKSRGDGDTVPFADKCWEVISKCHQDHKVCPRDGKTFGHQHCRHCIESLHAKSL